MICFVDVRIVNYNPPLSAYGDEPRPLPVGADVLYG